MVSKNKNIITLNGNSTIRVIYGEYARELTKNLVNEQHVNYINNYETVLFPTVPIIVTPIIDIYSTEKNNHIGNLYLFPGYTIVFRQDSFIIKKEKPMNNLQEGAFVIGGTNDKYFRLINRYIPGQYNTKKGFIKMPGQYNGILIKSILDVLNKVSSDTKVLEHILQ